MTRLSMIMLCGFLAVSLMACEREEQAGTDNDQKIGGPYYFQSFEGKSHPWMPVGEVQEDDKPDDAYYAAYFDSNGRIVRLEKYLSSHRQWTYEYAYDSNGKAVAGRYVDDKTNTVKDLVFDSDGKLTLE
ncbi:MAG: DUF6156 family protein [Dongiaceae bacterium]